TVARLRATGVRVVSNIADRATGRPAADASARIQLGHHEAVVVGVATDSLATYRVAVRPTLDLAEPVAWARINFPKLFGERGDARSSNPPIPIVLSHAGILADRGMLPLVPRGTLFAGAHDHQRFIHPFAR